MRSQLNSELIKLVSTRTVYGLTAGAAAVVALGTWSTIASADAATISGAMHTQQFFMLTSVNLALFAVVLGIRAFTDEFRFGTIVPSVLSTARRGRVMAAKAVIA